MKITCWRIVHKRYAKNAFNGEGARKYPGRWNHRGIPVIYTSATLSLATLEILVNIGDLGILKHYVSIPVTFDEELCEHIPLNKLPRDWADDPAPPSTRDIGTSWIESSRTLVLAVPSSVIPIELNYLLNPMHPNFSKLNIGEIQPFPFDPRLYKNK